MGNQPERIRVVGLGQACVDFSGTLSSFPREDGKVELMNLSIQCGGPASSAMVTLSRLGISTSFLGSVSDDSSGVKIIKNLQREKVDVSCLKMSPGYTSQFAFIAINRNTGERTIFWHKGSVPHLKKEEVNIRLFHDAELLHVDSLMIEAATEAAGQAKELGMKVVMDAGTMREGSKELVALVDVVIASETFLGPLAGTRLSHEKKLRAIKELGAGQVVITLGPQGSVGMNENGRMIRQEAFSVRAKDTTGAGDVYHGAYIYGLLQGWDMSECMRFASATAALKCTMIGAQTGIPDLQEVREFMKTHKTGGRDTY